MAAQPESTVTSATPQGTNAGTNATTKPLTQTQAPRYNPGAVWGFENSSVINPLLAPDQIPTGFTKTEVPIEPGAGATDDSGRSSMRLVNDATPVIEPRPNILDQYPSYTWQASVYMMTPDQLAVFQKNPRQKPNGYNLLFQSGGAAAGSGVAKGQQGATPDNILKNTDGRNPFFTEDFYIDNISFLTLAAGKGTGMAHSTAELKFTVTEPSNISLLDRLYLAAQDLSPMRNQKINYSAVVYLMVIRFYAINTKGEIVQVGATDATDPAQGSRYSLVEKYIPFMINEISFSITSNLVTYEWNCTPVGINAGLRVRRATIPFEVELTGGKVDDLLTGRQINSPGTTTATAPATQTAEQSRNQNVPTSSTPPPPKVSSSTSIRGLIEAMNLHQQKLVQNNERTYPDIYKIQYTPEAEALIKNATITKPSDTLNKSATPAGPAVVENTQASSPTKQAVITTSRNFPITAGMQMVQALEMVIRSSNFVTDQSIVEFDEKTNLPKPNPKAANKDQGMKWFNIIPSARPLSDQYDTRINDFAMEIVYTISIYELRQFDSAFFPPPKFNGIHKKYYYWFTGENTAVLDYKETFNTQYQLQVSGSAPKGSIKDRIDQARSSSMRDIPFVMNVARSNESSQGALNRANELGANAGQNIYNPGDLAQTRLQILGDPAWIMQGSIIGVADPKKLSPVAFNDDGSINFDTSEVLFEIAWQRPEDYTLSTGLADPYSKTEKLTKQRQPLQSRIYRCISVLNEFRGGMFTQTIEGGLFTFPIKSGINRAPDSPQPSDTIQTVSADGTTTTAAESDSAGGGIDTGGTDTSVRPNVDTPSIPAFVGNGGRSAGGGASGSWGDVSSLSTGFFNSALMQNTAGGGPGLRFPTGINFPKVGVGASTSSDNKTSNDSIQPTVPPAPVTSNGTVDSNTAGQNTPRLNNPQIISRET